MFVNICLSTNVDKHNYNFCAFYKYCFDFANKLTERQRYTHVRVNMHMCLVAENQKNEETFLVYFIKMLLLSFLLFRPAGLGCGLVYAATLTITCQYFDKRRGLALGIVTTGTAAHLLALSPPPLSPSFYWRPPAWPFFLKDYFVCCNCVQTVETHKNVLGTLHK